MAYPWKRVSGFALGVGLLTVAACGTVPGSRSTMLGYSPGGIPRSGLAASSSLPVSLAPKGPSKPPADQSPPRPLPFFTVLDQASRHHERGTTELGKGDADAADVEFQTALALLMNPAADAPLRASFRSARPAFPPAPPRWEDRGGGSPADAGELDEAAAEEGDPLAAAPALISPDDVKAIEEGAKGAAAAPEIDRQRFDVPVIVNDKVRVFLHYFSTHKYELVSRAFERASRYLPMMREIFRQKGLPQDLLNLAFIESAFNPRARSRALASGIWQFMEDTGRRFGMRSGFWVDHRRDPELSTRGAAEYLGALYRIFESWPLALAAYNAGEGKVQQAIARQKTTDFWRLRLPKETQLFVPAFMAMTIIAKDPARYGFTPPPEKAPETETVHLNESVDLWTIARAAQTTPEVIRDLNPTLLRGATPSGPFLLRVPAGSADGFLDRLAELPRPPRHRWAQHRIRKGETWATLARRHRLSVAALLELNGRTTPGALKVGSVVLVPGRGTAVVEAVPDPTGGGPPATPAPAIERRYTVRQGDTLGKIASAHGIRLEDLQRWNGLKRGQRLRPGQALIVQASRPTGGRALAGNGAPAGHAAGAAASAPARATGPQTVRYTVRPGDTLWNIAQVFGVSLEDLKRWNGLGGRGKPLKPGQELQIVSERSS